jgi:tyrosyl-tRNA synthetase
LIKQGAVEVNGTIDKDVKKTIVLNPGEMLALRVGKKRFLRVVGV